jgi:hypothetical protein
MDTKRQLTNRERGTPAPPTPAADRDEQGAALVAALFVTVILMMLGSAMLTLSTTDGQIAHNDVRAEGAFYAAEGALSVAVAQLSTDPVASAQAIPVTTIGGDYTFRSGGRNAGGPQPLQLLGTQPAEQYALGSGSATYSSAGYVFRVYQINVTGSGPRNATREIEAQVAFGPIQE